MSKPTEHQQLRLDDMIHWAMDKKDPYTILTGRAGTGKSFISKAFIEQLSGVTVGLTAMTHQACKVLSDMTDMDTSTLHSKLSLKPKRVNGNFVLEQGEEKFDLFGTDIILVDEASMVSTDVVSFVKDDVKRNNRKYVFVCDGYQIPPSGENISPIFDLAKPITLHDIVRQAKGSPIIELGSQVTDMIDMKKINYNFIRDLKNDMGSIITVGQKDFFDLIYDTDFFDVDKPAKVVAWTNDAVLEYNKLVCNSYGIEGQPFAVGQNVIFNSPVIKHDEVIVQNNHVGVCTHIIKREQLNSYPLYEVKIDNLDDVFYLVPDEFEFEHKKKVKQLLGFALADPSKWGDYYRYTDKFSDIRSPFASTVHKAQGSTFHTTFIDAKDINKNYDKLEVMRIAYTAITRASHDVVINGDLFT